MHAAHARSASNTVNLVRDVFIGAVLFIASAAFCLWQNTRVAALFDLSYLLDTSWRISLGQLPYRNFPFAHAPGTFLLHAAIIKIFGRVYWPHILCAALESGAATLLTWRILLRVLRPFGERAWWGAALLAVALVPLGIYSIYPHPIYDGDAILAALLALYLFVRAAEFWDYENGGVAQPEIAGVPRNVAAGAACILPLLFKQNIGLAFLLAVVVAVAAVAGIHLLQRKPVAQQLWFFCGLVAALAVTALVIHLTVGLASYRYWTLTFAAQRRLPGMAAILGVYHQTSLLWTVPAAIAGIILLRAHQLQGRIWPRVLGFLLLAAPFLWTIASLLLTTNPDDRADQLLALWPHLLVLAGIFAVFQVDQFVRGKVPALSAVLPLLLLATIHGTFLSQQLWGSTYAIWPPLVLLIALLLLEVREIAVPLAVTVSAALLLCGSLYAASLERLDYLHLDGAITHSKLPALRGMATPGPWLGNFEGLVHFADAAIPAGDGIVLVPGEEPFYFATGRTPQFPVLLTDLATDPYTPEQTATEMRARDIGWLIVKRDLQLTAPPDYETPQLLQAVQQNFALYCALPGYDIYQRR